jgi:hypothetical protein
VVGKKIRFGSEMCEMPRDLADEPRFFLGGASSGYAVHANSAICVNMCIVFRLCIAFGGIACVAFFFLLCDLRPRLLT